MKNLNNIFILLTLLSLSLIACKPSGEKFLNLEFAKKMQATAGLEVVSESNKLRHIRVARSLEKKALALAGKNKDAEALTIYEQALNLYGDSALYYNYGKSLAHTPRLADSVRAYAIALKLGHEKPEQVLYSAAQAYSRMGNAEEAYFYLEEAVAKGYTSFQEIETDPELSFLRARGDWVRRLNGFNPLKGRK